MFSLIILVASINAVLLTNSLYEAYASSLAASLNFSNSSSLTLMLIEIDFNSDEAIYIQLRNQIIMGIATSMIHEGDTLPSVRQLADNIGINMHTVNKAYTVLKQEGYVKVDRRKGAVIALDVDRMRAVDELRKELQVILAKSSCKNISRQEVHELIDEIYEEYGGLN